VLLNIKKCLLAAALGGIAALNCTQAIKAEEYPSRPVHILLGTAAGGAADTVARLYAKELTREMKQTFIVENMPGAYAMRPMEAVARGEPDGYTFVLASSDVEWLPAIKRDYPFSIAKDFTPVAAMTSSPMSFVINKSLPAASLKDFVGYAKSHVNELRYGTGGIGSPMHMAVELLELNAGIRMAHIPYRSGAGEIADLISGRIELGAMALISAASIQNGEARIVAQTGPKRHPMFPDVPTATESGYPDVELEFWLGLLGPPNLPGDIVSRLDSALKAISQDGEFQKDIEKLGMSVDFRDSAEFSAYLGAEAQRWNKLIPEMNIPVLD
jgi:tripartite-type tricarboxylate transporter receptor subunit TctC